MQNRFDLSISVDADEWAYMKRRIAYLESVLVQIFRDKIHIQEWFDAATLCGLRFQGLPASRGGLTRHAKAQNWTHRWAQGQGGARLEYHYTSLPSAAFDDLIARIANAYPDQRSTPQRLIVPPVNAPMRLANSGNTAPPWVLPLLRLLKEEGRSSPSALISRLADSLPLGMEPPTLDDIDLAFKRYKIAP